MNYFRAALIVAALGPLGLFANACGNGDSTAAALDSPQGKAAIEHYRSYLEERAAELVERTAAMASQIKAGELAEAESSYAAARVPFGQIKPAVVASFGDLDSRASETPASEFGGFHRIEEALWAEGTTAGLSPVANELLSEVKELQHRLKTFDLRATHLVGSANSVLGDVATSEIDGKEEPNSHIDMLDASAKVEGAEAVFDAVKAAVVNTDPKLAANVGAKFEDAYEGLRNFGTPAKDPGQPRPPAQPGSRFVLYAERTPAELFALGRKISALSESLSQVSALLRQ